MSFRTGLAQLIQAVRRNPLVYPLARWWVNRYPEGSVTAIPSGHLAGLLWQRQHRQRNAFWLGQYEIENQAVFLRYLKAGDCAYDLGANAGFFTLLAARLVGSSGKVLAFEPDPQNLAQLKEHIRLNAFAQVTVLPIAVSDGAGTAHFTFGAQGGAEGHLSATASGAGMDVETRALDSFLQDYPAPTFIKMDVEGAETAVLKGALKVLNQVKPVWLVELHGPEATQICATAFRAAGYQLFELSGKILEDGQAIPFQVIAEPTKNQ